MVPYVTIKWPNRPTYGSKNTSGTETIIWPTNIGKRTFLPCREGLVKGGCGHPKSTLLDLTLGVAACQSAVQVRPTTASL